MKFQRIHAAVNHHLSRRLAWFATLVGLAAIAMAPALGNGLLQVPRFPPELNRIPDKNQMEDMNSEKARKQSFEVANAERKKQIGDESAKLLKLATELKAEVDKTSKDTLSIGIIRKAGEIEKLAHDVKEKMKLTMGAS
jgi:hypothetical protein